tara:strand:- start:5162 stop:7546 length:2385 start_codon:yes stop_codon:yes gene_type:complete
MAKLPRYKPGSLMIEPTPKLQFNSAAYVNQANSMNRALDKMQAVIEPAMRKGAIDKALEFNVANPITLDQLNEAKQTGVNPIEAYQNGGMIYNEVIQKTYAQQAATQLALTDQTNNESVLAEVTAGTLKDLDVIKERLSSGIKGNAQVLLGMSPEVANSYTKSSAAYGHTYFKAITKELSSQAELEQQLISEQTYVGSEKQWERALENITDMTELNEYKELILSNSLTQFRLTGKPVENLNALRKRLEKSEIEKIAQVAASENYTTFGLNTDQVMEGLIVSETIGRHSDYYQQLAPGRQKEFRTAVKANMQNLMLGDKANKEGITAKYGNISKRLDNLEIVSSSDFNKLPVINDIDNKNYGRKGFLIQKQIDANQALDLSADAFAAYISEQTSTYDFKKGLTQDESERVEYLETMQQKMIGRDLKEPVEGMLLHPAFKERELINIDPVQFGDQNYVNDLTQEISQRKADMSAYRSHRNTTNTDLFTKNEINGLVNTWNQSSTNEQIALSTFLVQQFPDNAHEIFQDIAPKSSVFSQIGYLTLNGLQNGADARYMEITTTHILQGMEIDKLKVQTYMMGTAKDKAVADSLGTSFNNDPNLKQQIIKTADYIYYSLNQTSANDFVSEDYEEALQMASGQIEKDVIIPDPFNVVDGVEQLMISGKAVYGGIASHNNQKLPIPSAIKQETFSDMIEDATLEDFNAALSDREGNLYQFSPTEEAPQFELEQYQDAVLEFNNDTTASLSQGKSGMWGQIDAFRDLSSQPMYAPFENNGTRLYLNFVELHRIMNLRYPGQY